MTVLHAPAESAPSADTGGARHVCPECGARFEPASWRQIFCCTAHKTAFHNRQTVRGRTLVPLVIAARITRGGSRGDTATGITARRDADRLMDGWAAEDREAGRPSLIDYVRRRKALGYELP